MGRGKEARKKCLGGRVKPGSATGKTKRLCHQRAEEKKGKAARPSPFSPHGRGGSKGDRRAAEKREKKAGRLLHLRLIREKEKSTA